MGELEIKLPSGGTAIVKGTPAEIADVLRLAGLSGAPADAPKMRERAAPKAEKKDAKRAPARKKTGPRGSVADLVTEGFFKKARTLGEIREELKREGHVYKVTDLSPAVFRMVRDKELRRTKSDSKRWVYAER
jgi:hypothetical protein